MKPSVTKLKRISHKDGDILHALKQSEIDGFKFAEAYFTHIRPGAVKGWKKHLKMDLNLTVPVGMVKFYVRCEEDDKTEIYTIGVHNYCRLTIPCGYWVAFKGVSDSTSLVLNIANYEHDPSESVIMPFAESDDE